MSRMKRALSKTFFLVVSAYLHSLQRVDFDKPAVSHSSLESSLVWRYTLEDRFRISINKRPVESIMFHTQAYHTSDF